MHRPKLPAPEGGARPPASRPPALTPTRLLAQVNNLREIQALRRLSPHPGIIKLCEVLYDQPTGRLALVFELMDMNIYELIRGRRHYLPEARLKDYMYQLLKSMDHMHRNGIFHRDIKVRPRPHTDWPCVSCGARRGAVGACDARGARTRCGAAAAGAPTIIGALCTLRPWPSAQPRRVWPRGPSR